MKRRQVLTRGLGLGAGSAGLLLVGCGDDDDDDDNGSGTATSTSTATSPSTGGPKRGGTLRVTHIGPSALPFDPHQSPAESQGVIWDTVGGTLLRANRSLEIRPFLAEKYESADPVTFIFTLHDGIKYESREPVNGRDFTAEDVVYNVERARSEDPSFLMAKPKFKFLDKVEAVDAKTVRFTMQKPYAPFPALMSIGFWFAARECIERYGDANVADAVRGAGPYKAVQIDEANFLRLERNENWFGEGPWADAVEATFFDPGAGAAAFVSGQLEVMSNSTAQDRKLISDSNTPLKTQNAVSAGHFSYEMNTLKAPFDDPRIRRAIHLAFDREALVRLTGAASNPGEPVGVIAPWLAPFALSLDELGQLPGFRTPKDEDIAEAKRLIEAAGYSTSNPLRITAGAWVAWAETFAVWIKDWVRPIGIEVTIDPIETYAGMIGRLAEKNYDSIVGGYSIGFEPDDQIYDFYHTSGQRNYTSFDNPDIDRAIDAQQAELDRTKRIEILKQLQLDILDADPGLIWLHGNGIVTAMKPNVDGWENTPDTVHDYRFDQVWIG